MLRITPEAMLTISLNHFPFTIRVEILARKTDWFVPQHEMLQA
jgi:hypothetical protein